MEQTIHENEKDSMEEEAVRRDNAEVISSQMRGVGRAKAQKMKGECPCWGEPGCTECTPWNSWETSKLQTSDDAVATPTESTGKVATPECDGATATAEPCAITKSNAGRNMRRETRIRRIS